MKKIILNSLIFASCFALITSCSKNVKAPANAKTTTATTTSTQTQTQNQNQQGHTCGGGSSTTHNSGSGY